MFIGLNRITVIFFFRHIACLAFRPTRADSFWTMLQEG